MFLFGRPNIRKMSAEHDVDGLVGLLTHRNAQTRLEAAEALAELNEGRGWRYLMDTVRDPSDALVQAAAADILAGLGHPRAVDALKEAAQSARGETLDAIQAALETLQPAAADEAPEMNVIPQDQSDPLRLTGNATSAEGGVTGIYLEPARPAALESGQINVRPAELHLNAAVDLRENELQERGLVETRLALWLRPDYAEAWYVRGVLFEDLEREREALSAYQQALAIDPQHTEAREAYQELQETLGDGPAFLENGLDPLDVQAAMRSDLGSNNWRRRRDALGALPVTAAIEPELVINCMDDEEREVRHAAIEAIARLHLTTAAERLLTQEESSWLLRFAILDALSSIGAVSGLVDVLREEMNKMQHRNPVFGASKDPLVELEYDQLLEIGLLALERTGDVTALLDQAEGNAWEDVEIEDFDEEEDWEEDFGEDQEGDEAYAGEDDSHAQDDLYNEESDGDEEDDAEADEDMLSYVDETGLMVSQALERLAARSLTGLSPELLERLAVTPDLSLLDPTSENPVPVVVHDFSHLRAAAAEEIRRRTG